MLNPATITTTTTASRIVIKNNEDKRRHEGPKNKKNKNDNGPRKWLLVVLAIIMAVSGAMMIKDLIGYKKAADLNQQAVSEGTQFEAPQIVEATSEIVEPTEPRLELEFAPEEATLEEAEAPQEEVSYPHVREAVMKLTFPESASPEMIVMCDNEDDYYFLNHTPITTGETDEDGLPTFKEATAGSVYVRAIDYKDYNGDIVFFGHSMKNGTMLKYIKKFDPNGQIYDSKVARQYYEGEKFLTLTFEGGVEKKLSPFYCYHAVSDSDYMSKHHGSELKQFVLEKTGVDYEDDTVYIFITCSYDAADNRTYLFCKEAQ